MSSACASSHHPDHSSPTAEAGFLLLGAIVMIAVVLIVLAIAAPRVARDLRREKDVEAVHRGNQYVRAIQLYYRKFGHYPGSLDQLEHTNSIRFLRQRYTDPITGQDDFAIIPVGQNKTTVKTFFGAPLAGLPTSAAGAGSLGSMLSPGIGANAGPAAPTAVGAAGATSPTGAAGATTPASPPARPAPPEQPLPRRALRLPAPPLVARPASSVPTGSAGGGLSQPFMGVSLGAKGDSVIELNEQTDYGTWEFLYDPRLDQLKARAAALNGGGPGSIPGSSLGQPAMPTNLTSPGGATPNPTSPTTSPAAPSTSPTQP